MPSQDIVTPSAGIGPADSFFIAGQTRSGQPFRPSDWVDRVAGLFATFGRDKRLRYSPWVHPATLDGRRGLWLDAGFRYRDPCGYDFLMGFVAAHDLTVSRVARPDDASAADLRGGDAGL